MFYDDEKKEQFDYLVREFRALENFRLQDMCVEAMGLAVGQAVVMSRNDGRDWNEITEELGCSDGILFQIRGSTNYQEAVKVYLRDRDLNESELTLSDSSDISAWFGIEIVDAKAIILTLIFERMGLS